MYGSAGIRLSQIGSPDHDYPVLDRDIPYSDVCDLIKKVPHAKRTNKETDKPNVADSFIHSTTCHT